MTKYLLLILVFTGILTFTACSGCTWDFADKSSAEVSSLEESRQLALNYVRDLDSYKSWNLTKPVLIETKPLNCTSCWQFVYEFDLVSEKDLYVVDTARVTVTVAHGEVVEAVYVQGSRYNPQPGKKLQISVKEKKS